MICCLLETFADSLLSPVATRALVNLAPRDKAPTPN